MAESRMREPGSGRRDVASMALVVREAEQGDAEVLLDLIDALADYERLARPTSEARARLVRDGFGSQPRFRAFLVESGGVAEGYAIVLTTYSSFLALPTLYLEDLFVKPEARGRGVGGALFRYLARLAVEEGFGRMEWVVLDWNRTAIDFYERLGARRLAEWLPYRLTRKEMERIAAGAANRE
jgi:GNAT superfamily N-acetyltransferase